MQSWFETASHYLYKNHAFKCLYSFAVWAVLKPASNLIIGWIPQVLRICRLFQKLRFLMLFSIVIFTVVFVWNPSVDMNPDDVQLQKYLISAFMQPSNEKDGDFMPYFYTVSVC